MTAWRNVRSHFGSDLMLALGLAVAVGVGLLAAFVLADARRDAWDRAREAGHNLTHAIRQEIARSIESLDLLLKVAVAELDQPNSPDLDPVFSYRAIFDRAAMAQHIYAVLILDNQGEVLFDSRDAPRRFSNFADREFFLAHREDDGLGLHVTRPFELRSQAENAIAFSRRLSHSDGQFRGVVVGIVRLTDLRDLFSSMTLGPRSSITLHRSDGTTLMRAPYEPSVIGRNVGHGAAFRRFLQSAEGQFIEVSALDGVERLYSHARIPGAPLLINVALARSDIEAGWRPRAMKLGSVAGVLIIVLLLAIFWLRREVGRRHAAETEAAKARDAAEAAGQARAQFLAIMSHEIRTPMNGIIGLADLLLGTNLDAEQVHYLTTLHASARHLVSLLSDVLDISRLDANRLEFESTPFYPAEVAQGALRMFEETARKKGLHLDLVLPASLPEVCGDPARLRQVLVNLLANAVKFTTEGHVSLIVAAPSHDPAGVRLSFEVADTGIGIAADVLPRLFEDFTQADGSIARRYGGSGLGLSICRRLVTGMGGSIVVESMTGRGSRFRFHVVMPEAAARMLGTDAALVDNPPMRPLSILLAEDDATNQLVARAMLQKMGHSVEVVPDGQAALLALASQEFDIVLMDVMMPTLDGLDTARRIRASRAAWYSIPIIALTADASRENDAACRAAGMTDFITKPITLGDLTAALRRNLGDQTLRPALPAMPSPPARAGMPAETEAFQPEVLQRYAVQFGCEAAEEIRDGFLSELDRRISRLKSAVRASDPLVLQREAHALKGAASAVGFTAMARLAAQMERGAAVTPTAVLTAQAEEMAQLALVGAATLKVLHLLDA